MSLPASLPAWYFTANWLQRYAFHYGLGVVAYSSATTNGGIPVWDPQWCVQQGKTKRVIGVMPYDRDLVRKEYYASFKTYPSTWETLCSKLVLTTFDNDDDRVNRWKFAQAVFARVPQRKAGNLKAVTDLWTSFDDKQRRRAIEAAADMEAWLCANVDAAAKPDSCRVLTATPQTTTTTIAPHSPMAQLMAEEEITTDEPDDQDEPLEEEARVRECEQLQEELQQLRAQVAQHASLEQQTDAIRRTYDARHRVLVRECAVRIARLEQRLRRLSAQAPTPRVDAGGIQTIRDDGTSQRTAQEAMSVLESMDPAQAASIRAFVEQNGDQITGPFANSLVYAQTIAQSGSLCDGLLQHAFVSRGQIKDESDVVAINEVSRRLQNILGAMGMVNWYMHCESLSQLYTESDAQMAAMHRQYGSAIPPQAMLSDAFVNFAALTLFERDGLIDMATGKLSTQYGDVRRQRSGDLGCGNDYEVFTPLSQSGKRGGCCVQRALAATLPTQEEHRTYQEQFLKGVERSATFKSRPLTRNAALYSTVTGRALDMQEVAQSSQRCEPNTCGSFTSLLSTWCYTTDSNTSVRITAYCDQDVQPPAPVHQMSADALRVMFDDVRAQTANIEQRFTKWWTYGFGWLAAHFDYFKVTHEFVTSLCTLLSALEQAPFVNRPRNMKAQAVIDVLTLYNDVVINHFRAKHVGQQLLYAETGGGMRAIRQSSVGKLLARSASNSFSVLRTAFAWIAPFFVTQTQYAAGWFILATLSQFGYKQSQGFLETAVMGMSAMAVSSSLSQVSHQLGGYAWLVFPALLTASYANRVVEQLVGVGLSGLVDYFWITLAGLRNALLQSSTAEFVKGPSLQATIAKNLSTLQETIGLAATFTRAPDASAFLKTVNPKYENLTLQDLSKNTNNALQEIKSYLDKTEFADWLKEHHPAYTTALNTLTTNASKLPVLESEQKELFKQVSDATALTIENPIVWTTTALALAAATAYLYDRLRVYQVGGADQRLAQRQEELAVPRILGTLRWDPKQQRVVVD